MSKAILLLALLAIFTSCEEKIRGNGNVVEETREAAPFHSLNLSGAFTVYITPQNYTSVQVRADENLLEHIETYVRKGVLHVKPNASFERYRALELHINMKDFQRLEASGAIKVDSEGPLQGDKVQLDFSGAVEADLQLNTNELTGDFSGSSNIRLRGNARKMNVESSGAITLDAEEFKTERCQLDMSGSGRANVFATQSLKVDVSGSAKVNYTGNPGEVKQNISGSASINKL